MTLLLNPLVIFNHLILYSTQHCWHLPSFEYSFTHPSSVRVLRLCPRTLLYIFNLGYLIHSHTFSCIMQTALKSLSELWVLSRTSDTFVKMFTRSLRHLKFHKSQIQLLFSIRKTYSSAGILYLSKRSPSTQLPKKKTGCHSLCCYSPFPMSKQPPSAVYIPPKCYYYHYYPSSTTPCPHYH